MQAEDGNPTTLAKSLEGDKGVKSIEVFNTPNSVVKNIKDVKDGFTYRKTANVMRGSTVG